MKNIRSIIPDSSVHMREWAQIDSFFLRDIPLLEPFDLIYVYTIDSSRSGAKNSSSQKEDLVRNLMLKSVRDVLPVLKIAAVKR